MLVAADKMLKDALKGKYAVDHFNINNLEWTKAILETAQENNSLIILGVSEGAGKYMGGYKTVIGMVKGMIEELNITVPVAIHLDHGSFEGARKCTKTEFIPAMFNGSRYPIDENIEKAKEIVELAHSKEISVETEIGSIDDEEDGVIGQGEITDKSECKGISELGIDFLTAGIGNIHGVYPENWKGLDFNALGEVKGEIGETPLVLHGGTGIPTNMIKEAINFGMSKININTECRVVFTEATRKYSEENKNKEKKEFDPGKVLKPGYKAIKAKVKEKWEFLDQLTKQTNLKIRIRAESINLDSAF